MSTMHDIILKNASYIDPEIKVVKNRTIVIDNGVISDILDSSEGLEAKEVIDGSELLWMPGLIDGHIHTSQQLLRGRLMDEKPVIWKRVNVPFESMLDEDMSCLSAEVAALEMISAGTTGFVDAGGKYPEVFAEVYDRAGMRARLTVMTNDNPHFPASIRAESPAKAVARLREMAGNLKGDMLKPMYSITTPVAASEELFRRVWEAAAEDGIPAETHMNEYASEVTTFIETFGERPFVWMEREGLLKAKTLAPHSIFLTPEEIDVIKENDIRIAHCPYSNCGKGIPQTPTLLRRGIKVGFGSDGSAHGGLDLFKEMRLFRGVMVVSHGISMAESAIMPAEKLLKMAFEPGALFMDGLGRIEKGKKADMIAIDTDVPYLWPTQNLVHSVVESACGSDVQHMIINGRIVMKNREFTTLDKERIKAHAKELIGKNPWLVDWK